MSKIPVRRPKLSVLLTTVFCILLSIIMIPNHLLADGCVDCDHSDHKDHNDDMDYRGVARLVFQPILCEPDQAAFLIAEGGYAYWRLNGTYGFDMGNSWRAKFTGEFLSEKNRYLFETGQSDAWVNQIAFGADVQKMVNWCRLISVDFGTSYSHCFGKHLSKKESVERYVTGSDAYDLTLGATAYAFCDGIVSFYGGYDWVDYINCDYKDKYHGFGGGFEWTQPLFSCFDFVLGADFRNAYHYYEGAINWNRPLGCGVIGTSLFGSYTDGKHRLGNEARFGIEVGMTFGGSGNCCPEEACQPTYCCPSMCSLNTWVSSPAVYRPKVLAVSKSVCAPVVKVRDLTPPQVPKNIGVNFDASAAFEGSKPITYTLQVTPVAPVLDGEFNTFKIDPNTGVITGYGTFVADVGLQDYIFTVRAKNTCGEATVTFTQRIFSNLF